VFYKEDERGEAGLDGQYRDWSGGKTVGDPSLDAVPKYVQIVLHSHKGCVQIRPIQENRGEEGRGQPVAEIRWEALPRRREPFDRVEGALGEGQPLAEVGTRRERGREPISQPPHCVLGGEVQVVQSDSRR